MCRSGLVFRCNDWLTKEKRKNQAVSVVSGQRSKSIIRPNPCGCHGKISPKGLGGQFCSGAQNSDGRWVMVELGWRIPDRGERVDRYLRALRK